MKKLGLTEAASSAGSGIRNNILGSGKAVLIISNKEMKDIIKIVESLEKSALLKKASIETIENKVKGQKDRFLALVFGILSTS